MRLDRYLSNSTGISRSEIKKLIRQQAVTVNGNIARNGNQQVNNDDDIRLENEFVDSPQPRYFMFHKPQGVVSATKDSDYPTAIDYFDEPHAENLQIAGRLDVDATGLLLITDDGQWNHRVTAPTQNCFKTYEVELAEAVKDDHQNTWMKKFTQGIWLEQEKRRTLPAKLTFKDSHNLQLLISEGKYHQVKRMCAAMGNRVENLHRSAIGEVKLDLSLAPGEYRPLTALEVSSLA